VLVDATAAIGPGDRLVLGRALAAVRRARLGGESPSMFVAVNKVDRARPEQVIERLATAAAAVEVLEGETRRTSAGAGPPDARVDGEAPDRAAYTPDGADVFGDVEFFPVSAVTGAGLDELMAAVVSRLPEGPAYYPEDLITDTPEAVMVAELVREQLLVRAREELPHAIACRVTEWEWPRIRCEIVVERDSQKAIVIGKGGEVLKAVGTAVRAELPPGAFLELFVRVEKHWQQREDQIDRLGY